MDKLLAAIIAKWTQLQSAVARLKAVKLLDLSAIQAEPITFPALLAQVYSKMEAGIAAIRDAFEAAEHQFADLTSYIDDTRPFGIIKQMRIETARAANASARRRGPNAASHSVSLVPQPLSRFQGVLKDHLAVEYKDAVIASVSQAFQSVLDLFSLSPMSTSIKLQVMLNGEKDGQITPTYEDLIKLAVDLVEAVHTSRKKLSLVEILAESSVSVSSFESFSTQIHEAANTLSKAVFSSVTEVIPGQLLEDLKTVCDVGTLLSARQINFEAIRSYIQQALKVTEVTDALPSNYMIGSICVGMEIVKHSLVAKAYARKSRISDSIHAFASKLLKGVNAYIEATQAKVLFEA